MLFSHERSDMRQFFFKTWQKGKNREILEPMEQLIVDVISQHPEYHHFFEDADKNVDRDFLPEMGETNPFLHLSMHIAIREQMSINQPVGVTSAYKKMLKKIKDPHEVEHQMMDCLGEMIWHAQRDQKPPDEALYMRCIKQKLIASPIK